MSSEPYLIAHLVRGEPTFDIAIKMPMHFEGTYVDLSYDEEWWIIPTSGHRAYPYWSVEITRLVGTGEPFNDEIPSPPTNWPDHYATDLSRDQARRDNYEARQANTNIEPSPLALSLGLVRPRTPIPRRV